MSYSMSPPQKPAPRPYSPYQNAGSPTNPGPYGPPPPKRQRMSPDPRSPPNGAPPYAHSSPHGLPNVGGYGNPYAPAAAQSPYGTPTYAQSPHGSFNTPQPYPYQQIPWQSQPATPAPQPQYGMRQGSPPQQQQQQQQPREMMPPPPRPNKEEREEKIGVEEIGDSLFGSGINLKDEENYMHSMYNNRHTQSDSFSTNQNTSFGSSTLSPNNSFNFLTQGTSFGSQETVNGPFAGTMGPTMSQEEIEVEQRRKREAAARNLAERRQHHLNNQFLQCNNVRKRTDRLAFNEGVKVNMDGVWVRQPETKVMTNGASTNGIVAADERTTGVQQEPKAESLVNQGTSFEQVVSLVSLAAGERLRGIIDEAYVLARARRYGDHGRVPPEFADIAEGEGKQRDEDVVPKNITGTQWDKLPDSSEVEMAETAKAKSKSSTPQPQHTISFQSTLNTQLLNLAERDKAAEQARLKKREARKRAAETGESATTPDATTAPADAVNGIPAEAAAPVKPLTKKEQLRQQKERNSNEAAAHSSTNQTAAMMALGKKGSRYSWMTGGATNMPVNRFAKPSSASGTATPAKVESGPTAPGVGAGPGAVGMVRAGSGGGAEPKVPEWGDWREEGVGGSGIQARDLVLVLERDGREKGTLQKVVNSLS